MADRPRVRGAPPPSLTGRLPVSSQDSPWWHQVSLQITGDDDLVGRTMSIEELSERIPSYPDGRRPRPRAVARRLRPILELVSRGPNGSLGRGAVYRIRPRVETPEVGRTDVPNEEIAVDNEWLMNAVRRMTKEK